MCHTYYDIEHLRQQSCSKKFFSSHSTFSRYIFRQCGEVWLTRRATVKSRVKILRCCTLDLRYGGLDIFLTEKFASVASLVILYADIRIFHFASHFYQLNHLFLAENTVLILNQEICQTQKFLWKSIFPISVYTNQFLVVFAVSLPVTCKCFVPPCKPVLHKFMP